MQPTKDTFYVALRDRLAACDPQRTITLNGASRPAIFVLENEAPEVAGMPGAFCLQWGNARPVPAGGSLMAMECTISYRSSGTTVDAEFDRGRALGSLDADLLAICTPRSTAKCDYSLGVARPLGSSIFWTRPRLNVAKESGKQYVGRDAAVEVFFFPEGCEL